MPRRTVRRGREAVNSIRVLQKVQHGSDSLLRQYRVSRKPTISISLRKKLELRCSSELNSVNLISRIHVAISLSENLRSYFQVHHVEYAYFATLISEKHGVRVSDRTGYDVAAHRAWIETVLHGKNYVGMIEPAYYPAVSFMPPHSEDWLSWHAHLVVWGTTAAELKDLKEIVNESEDSFRPGGTVFHFRKAKPSRIEPEVAYMCKSPRSEHYTYPAKRMIVDPVTRKRIGVPTGMFKQNKRALRTGKLVVVLSAMEDLTIEELLVSGEEGREVARTALLSAKQALQEEQRLRDEAVRLL